MCTGRRADDRIVHSASFKNNINQWAKWLKHKGAVLVIVLKHLPTVDYSTRSGLAMRLATAWLPLVLYQCKCWTASYTEIIITGLFFLDSRLSGYINLRFKKTDRHLASMLNTSIAIPFASQGTINSLCFNSSVADWGQRCVYFLQNRLVELMMTGSVD